MKLNREWQKQWEEIEIPEEKLTRIMDNELQQSSKQTIRDRMRKIDLKQLAKNKYTWLVVSGAVIVLLIGTELTSRNQMKSSSVTSDYVQNPSTNYENPANAEYGENAASAKQEESAVEFEEDGSDSSASSSGAMKIEGTDTGEATTSDKAAINSSKLAYFYNFTKYTETFSNDTEKLQKLVDDFGGYIETANIGDSSYSSSSQTAYYELRIPVSKETDFLKELEKLGKTTNKQVSTENYSVSYSDNESKIKALETEEESLLALLAKSDKVDDMLKIQDRLTTIRSQRETLVRENRSIDNQVDYLTVTLNLYEINNNNKDQVKEEKPSVMDRIKDSFKSQGEFWSTFAQDAVVVVVSLLPYLILPIAIVISLFYWEGRKKSKKKNKI